MNIKNDNTGVLKVINTKRKIKLATTSFLSSLVLLGSIVLPSSETLASQASAKTTDVQNGEYLSHFVKHKKNKKYHKKNKNYHKKKRKLADNDSSDSDSGQLEIGNLAPITGSLGFLGPAALASVQLAVEDINAAGGVFGKPVLLIEGDSSDNLPVAQSAVNQFLEQEVDVIIGPLSSAITLEIIDSVVQNKTILFSQANTAPQFTNYPDNGFYFRTSPSDKLQAKYIADNLIIKGQRTSILYNNESYGKDIADSFECFYESMGGQVTDSISYDSALKVLPSDFADEIAQISSSDPDNIVLVGFDETIAALYALEVANLGPNVKNIHGVDGNTNPGIGFFFLDALGFDDISFLEGFQGVQQGFDLFENNFEFVLRVWDKLGFEFEPAYAAEAYDAVIISALAAIIAGKDNTKKIAKKIPSVTNKGIECHNFSDCKALILSGHNIDYVGIGGAYNMDAKGEPTTAAYSSPGFARFEDLVVPWFPFSKFDPETGEETVLDTWAGLFQLNDFPSYGDLRCNVSDDESGDDSSDDNSSSGSSDSSS